MVYSMWYKLSLNCNSLSHKVLRTACIVVPNDKSTSHNNNFAIPFPLKIMSTDIKQLLDEIFVISRIKDWGKGYQLQPSASADIRLITLTKTLIILDITQTESSNCLIIHWTKQKKSCFCFFTDGKHHKACKLDMIMRDLECPWHDYCIICSYDITGTDFKNSQNALGQSEKR